MVVFVSNDRVYSLSQKKIVPKPRHVNMGSRPGISPPPPLDIFPHMHEITYETSYQNYEIH